MSFGFRTLIAVGLATIVCLSAARADTNIALVIGNSTYQHAGSLGNPANDAAAVAALFKASGFKVVDMRRDLGIAAMRKALGDFSEAARDADVAIIFFAGHGIEIDGINYLVPVDAKLGRDFDVEDEAISLDRILRSIEPARRLKFVILDACRDNPFSRGMRRTTRSIGRGLGRIDPTSSDTLVAYSTEAGTIAEDGNAVMSPFTEALVKHIATPGLDIRLAFGRVRDDVMRKTNNRQRPFVYGSLGGATTAIVGVLASEAQTVQALPSIPNICSAAEAHWKSAEAIGSKTAFEDHLLHFGSCNFTGLAAARIAALDRDTRLQTESEQRKGTEARVRPSPEESAHVADEARRKAEAERKRIAVVSPPSAPLGTQPRSTSFDGTWIVTRSVSVAPNMPKCGPKGSTMTIQINGSVVRGPGGAGSISPSGEFHVPGRANVFRGTLSGQSGSGRYSGKCSGTFTAVRN